MKLAERVGVEKCVEVLYPVDIKDANDYFKKFTSADYRELLKAARPFYRYQFKGLAEIIEDFRNNKTSKLQLKHLPGVKIGDDWVIVVTGETNVGKTSYVMNLAHELAERSIPTLVLPFERGPEAVGLRYLMVANSLEEDEFKSLNNEEWDDVIKNTVNLPLYFAMPKKDETVDLIKKAKRIFGVQVVIVDHFNLMVRNAMGKENENVVVERSLQELKRLGQDEKIIHILVHHLKKADNTGGVRKERTMDDLKGSSALTQDPECVVLLSIPAEGELTVKVEKNKGKMLKTRFKYHLGTGRLGDESDAQKSDAKQDDIWNNLTKK